MGYTNVFFTVLLRIGFTLTEDVAIHPVGSYPTFSSLHKNAVIFCCTFPGVTSGGRYPLFLPIGARTFLKNSLSTLFSRLHHLQLLIIGILHFPDQNHHYPFCLHNCRQKRTISSFFLIF